MKVVIPGGSGQIGTNLVRLFQKDGHEVVVVSRRRVRLPCEVALWDGRSQGAWAREIDGADVVVNLAGRSVNCRYDDTTRRQILDSRVASTRAVGEAITAAARPPSVWLQMLTATIYSHRFDAPNDEAGGVIGGAEASLPVTWRFSVTVAKDWEAACMNVPAPRTRKVLMRTAIVMSPAAGSAFDTMLKMVRAGLGGPWGDGAQYVSWIHSYDLERAINRLIKRDDIDGPVNICAPQSLPNSLFMAQLRRVANIPVGLPLPSPVLEFGAKLMKTETELVLKSRRVAPVKLLSSGFEFVFPTWAAAAEDLVAEWRRNRAARAQPSS